MMPNREPQLSSASIVLAKSGWPSALINSISALASLIASSIAGKKCVDSIMSKGGVSNGVLNFSSRGFIYLIYCYNNLLKRSEEHTSELQSRPHLVCRL